MTMTAMTATLIYFSSSAEEKKKPTPKSEPYSIEDDASFLFLPFRVFSHSLQPYGVEHPPNVTQLSSTL